MRSPLGSRSGAIPGGPARLVDIEECRDDVAAAAHDRLAAVEEAALETDHVAALGSQRAAQLGHVPAHVHVHGVCMCMVCAWCVHGVCMARARRVRVHGVWVACAWCVHGVCVVWRVRGAAL